MKLYYYVLAGLLVLPSAEAYGEAFVCAVTAQPQRLSRFIPSIDPSRLVAGATESCGQLVGDQATAAQIDLYNTVPYHYLKTVQGATVGGQVQPQSIAEMTQPEKDTVDAAIAAKIAEQQTYVNEANGATCLYSSLDDVNTKSAAFRANMDAVINSMTNVATTQAAIHELMNRLVNTMGVNLARCDLAHAKTR